VIRYRPGTYIYTQSEQKTSTSLRVRYVVKAPPKKHTKQGGPAYPRIMAKTIIGLLVALPRVMRQENQRTRLRLGSFPRTCSLPMKGLDRHASPVSLLDKTGAVGQLLDNFTEVILSVLGPIHSRVADWRVYRSQSTPRTRKSRQKIAHGKRTLD
jgi:hypothetical protein